MKSKKPLEESLCKALKHDWDDPGSGVQYRPFCRRCGKDMIDFMVEEKDKELYLRSED